MLVGHAITGGSISRTITLKEFVLLLPNESVAVHVTTFVPTRNVEPLGSVHTTVTVASQLSVAFAVEVTLLFEHCPASALTVMSAGTLIAGACVSLTVTVNRQLLVPATLVAVAVTVLVPTGKVCGEVIEVAPIL